MNLHLIVEEALLGLLVDAEVVRQREDKDQAATSSARNDDNIGVIGEKVVVVVVLLVIVAEEVIVTLYCNTEGYSCGVCINQDRAFSLGSCMHEGIKRAVGNGIAE